jgi:phosphohistidine phosphatase
MKTLLLLRHAKSSWNDPGQSDHDRTLTPRGRRAAELVGLYLAQRGDPPSLVLCSTARRALDTLEPLRHRLGVPFEARRELYLADPDALLEVLAGIDDRESCVLVIGHNPGLHELVLQLARHGDDEARARLREGFPTAALAVLELAITRWDEIRAGCGTLLELRVPRDLV